MRSSLRPSLAAVILTLCGLGGFVGFLMASAYFPVHAMVLRVLALVCFFSFGAVKVLVDLKSAAERTREAATKPRCGGVR